ncbi:MAG: sigma-54-dependent Fis family transcriptional regulator [Desulfobacteraceae bacterium]|nr:sigma-54-dependent Fis family transcriptional regulator [Desulfobacteraceae bacterium]
MKKSILIIDDEQDMRRLLKRSLEPDLNCRVETSSSGENALKKMAEESFDLVVADIKMPGMSGLELLPLVKRDHPDLPVIMMTAFGHIETAIEAMKHGAYDFITKPFDHDALVIRLEKALERRELVKENLRLQLECRQSDAFQEIIGKSAAMQKVFETIRMVAKSDLTVLITGESGTGKELTARAAHSLSVRTKAPFISVNCPTVPEHILESELFGYKKGAFTHATGNKDGLFQTADQGTIFLDEIGDVSPAIQTKLLRVIQEKEFKPLGSNKSVYVDVRIIASTNQDLKKKIEEKEFREDLYYRLNVLPIRLPPLRERPEDIPLIAGHLLEKHCAKLNKPLKRISGELMENMTQRYWEGNVRELENIVIRGIMFSPSADITPADVGLSGDASRPAGGIPGAVFDMPYREAKEVTLRTFNHAYIGDLLSRYHGNVTRAARECGLERQSLQQIIRRYGIKADEYR